jgi:hypothetical protein
MLKLCNQLEFESKRKPRGVANVISEKHNTLAGNTGLLGKNGVAWMVGPL